MPKPTDPASFRASATVAFNTIVVCAVVFAIGCAALGWWRGGIKGLVIGTVIGVVVGGCVVAATGLIWAMTQDGA